MVLNPLQFILGWFGYVKVPLSAIQLSIKQEDVFKKLCMVDSAFGICLDAQQTLTNFLRSGRLLERKK